MLQTLLFALLAAVSPGSGVSGPWMLLKSPVVVEAWLLRGEPEAPTHMADFEFLIDIRDANATEQVETFLIAVHDLPDALRVLRRTVVSTLDDSLIIGSASPARGATPPTHPMIWRTRLAPRASRAVT